MEGWARYTAGSVSHKTNAEVSSFPLLAETIPHALHRVSSSIFTADARFVISGSDDGNVRVWKAKASDKLGIITARERAAIEYRESLRDRWKHDQEVGKISR